MLRITTEFLSTYLVYQIKNPLSRIILEVVGDPPYEVQRLSRSKDHNP